MVAILRVEANNVLRYIAGFVQNDSNMLRNVLFGLKEQSVRRGDGGVCTKQEIAAAVEEVTKRNQGYDWLHRVLVDELERPTENKFILIDYGSDEQIKKLRDARIY